MTKVTLQIKNKAIELLSNSTSHGVSSIIKAKIPFFRYLWSFAVLLSTSLFAILVTQDIIAYLKFPVVTKVRFLDEGIVAFPVVGVCHSNPYITNASIIFIKDVIRKEFNITKTENISDLEFVNEILNEELRGKKIKTFLEYNYLGTNSSMKDSFGMSIEDFIIKCEFNGTTCNLTKDFVPGYTFINGKCYFYNTLGDKNIIGAFQSDGLSLELFAGYEELQPAYKNCMKSL